MNCAAPVAVVAVPSRKRAFAKRKAAQKKAQKKDGLTQLSEKKKGTILKKTIAFSFAALIMLLIIGSLFLLLENRRLESIERQLKIPKSFDVDQLLLKVLIRADEYSTIPVRVMNTGLNVENIRAEASYTVNDFIDISEPIFGLRPGQSKILELNVSSFNKLARTRQQEGIYVGSLQLSSDDTVHEIPVVIELESEYVLFDINLNPLAKSRTVAQGEDAAIEIRLFNLEGVAAVNVGMQYAVKDLKGNAIITESESVVVKTQSSFFKTIEVPDNMAQGQYVFTALASYGSSVGTASYLFEVVPSAQEAKAYDIAAFCSDDVLCWSLAGIMALIIFSLGAYTYFVLGAFIFRKLSMPLPGSGSTGDATGHKPLQEAPATLREFFRKPWKEREQEKIAAAREADTLEQSRSIQEKKEENKPLPPGKREEDTLDADKEQEKREEAKRKKRLAKEQAKEILAQLKVRERLEKEQLRHLASQEQKNLKKEAKVKRKEIELSYEKQLFGLHRERKKREEVLNAKPGDAKKLHACLIEKPAIVAGYLRKKHLLNAKRLEELRRERLELAVAAERAHELIKRQWESLLAKQKDRRKQIESALERGAHLQEKDLISREIDKKEHSIESFAASRARELEGETKDIAEREKELASQEISFKKEHKPFAYLSLWKEELPKAVKDISARAADLLLEREKAEEQRRLEKLRLRKQEESTQKKEGKKGKGHLLFAKLFLKHAQKKPEQQKELRQKSKKPTIHDVLGRIEAHAKRGDMRNAKLLYINARQMYIALPPEEQQKAYPRLVSIYERIK